MKKFLLLAFLVTWVSQCLWAADPAAVVIEGNYNLAYSGDKTCVYCYSTETNASTGVAWPGATMETAVGSDGNTYKVFKVPAGTDRVIFNSGWDTAQTADLEYTGAVVMNDEGATEVAVTFEGVEPDPEPVVIKGDYNLAYSGDKAKVYYYGEGVTSPEWPGVAMETAVGSDGNTYKVFKVPAGTTNVIFSITGDDDKTGDLVYTGSFIMSDNGATSVAVTFEGVEPDPEPVVIKGDYNLAYSGDKAKVYYYGEGVTSPEWPGVAMETAVGSDGNTYKVAKVPAGTTNVIFSITGDDDKTGDLVYTGSFIMSDNGATSVAVTFEGVEPEPEPVVIKGDYNLAYSGDKAKVYYYGEGVTSPEWPGVAMETAVGSDGNTYKVAKVPAGTTNVIFSITGDDDKTGDLVYTGSFIMSDNGATSVAVTFEGVEPEPEPVVIDGDYNLAYSGDKEKVYYYGEGVTSPEWPGVAMETAVGSDGNTYKVAKVPAGTTNVIFSITGDDDKTGDLVYTGSFIMSDNGATATKVVFNNGTVGVENIATEKVDAIKVYSAGGQLYIVTTEAAIVKVTNLSGITTTLDVNAGTNCFGGFARGLYLVNGKKVML